MLITFKYGHTTGYYFLCTHILITYHPLSFSLCQKRRGIEDIVILSRRRKSGLSADRYILHVDAQICDGDRRVKYTAQCEKGMRVGVTQSQCLLKESRCDTKLVFTVRNMRVVQAVVICACIQPGVLRKREKRNNLKIPSES